jgi:hypothetical protein
MDGVDSISALLSGKTIYLNIRDDDTGIFDLVDAFANLSRGNESVEEISFCLATDSSDDASGTHRYVIWDKIAEGIGNLQALNVISIENAYYVDGEDDPVVPDSEILACILRRLGRGIQIRMCYADALLWDTAAMPVFARVIHG